ncbi:hypothetical protein ACFQT0_13300 [Hymenobacter humi]|uniref:Uncharacterized protein n=1 Tax=Hymenobacter humi TaxID=1411620 RepID=A0ABW2U788_9BACT
MVYPQEIFLRMAVVWKDEHMLEVEFTASNASFKGTTQAYDTSESLSDLANKLVDFPNKEASIFHQVGAKDGYAYCSMRFYPIGGGGLIGVLIQLEENVSTAYRKEEKSKLALELIVEPCAIDNFYKQLKTMAHKQEGIALLVGRM